MKKIMIGLLIAIIPILSQGQNTIDNVDIGKVYNNNSTWAGIRHKDHSDAGAYGFLQGKNSHTLMNAVAGKSLYFRQNNVNIALMQRLSKGYGKYESRLTLYGHGEGSNQHISSSIEFLQDDDSGTRWILAHRGKGDSGNDDGIAFWHTNSSKWVSPLTMKQFSNRGHVGINTRPSSEYELDVNGQVNAKNGVRMGDIAVNHGNKQIFSKNDFGEIIYKSGSTDGWFIIEAADARDRNAVVKFDIPNREDWFMGINNTNGHHFVIDKGDLRFMAINSDGTTTFKEIQIQPAVVPDYVFEEEYDLKSLKEVESYIENEGHLPGIPSAEEIKENGGYLQSEMTMKLLEKIEELTLHTIQQQKEIEILKKQNK